MLTTLQIIIGASLGFIIPIYIPITSVMFWVVVGLIVAL
jgi:hypothetical protein